MTNNGEVVASTDKISWRIKVVEGVSIEASRFCYCEEPERLNMNWKIIDAGIIAMAEIAPTVASPY
jgi:hypothetical protein